MGDAPLLDSRRFGGYSCTRSTDEATSRASTSSSQTTSPVQGDVHDDRDDVEPRTHSDDRVRRVSRDWALSQLRRLGQAGLMIRFGKSDSDSDYGNPGNKG